MISDGFILGVDLDGVCGDYTAALRDVVAERTGAPLDRLPLERSWDFSEWGLTPGRVRGAAPGGGARTPHLPHHAAPCPGRPRRCGGCPTPACGSASSPTGSTSTGATPRPSPTRSTGSTPPGIPYRDLCFLGAKPQVEADCYVEDAPHNVAGPAGQRRPRDRVRPALQPGRRRPPGPRLDRGRGPRGRPGHRARPVAAGAAARGSRTRRTGCAASARATTPCHRRNPTRDATVPRTSRAVGSATAGPTRPRTSLGPSTGPTPPGPLHSWWSAPCRSPSRPGRCSTPPAGPSGRGPWPAGGAWCGWPPSCSGR